MPKGRETKEFLNKFILYKTPLKEEIEDEDTKYLKHSTDIHPS